MSRIPKEVLISKSTISPSTPTEPSTPTKGRLEPMTQGYTNCWNHLPLRQKLKLSMLNTNTKFNPTHRRQLNHVTSPQGGADHQVNKTYYYL